jgi:hypothetical protein
LFGGYNLLKNAIYLNRKVKSFKHLPIRFQQQNEHTPC